MAIGTCPCNYQDLWIAKILRNLKQLNLWPTKSLRNYPLVGLFMAMRRVKPAQPIMYTDCPSDLCKRYSGHNSEAVALTFYQEAGRFEKQVGRLCLTCVNEGEFSSAKCSHRQLD